jgi:hypothetical protein
LQIFAPCENVHADHGKRTQMALPPVPNVARYGQLDALVCVYRPEQNGSLNIAPTTIQISDSGSPNGPPKVTLVGGQNFCQRVTAGPAKITIRFLRPYDAKPSWTVTRSFSFPPGETDLLMDATDRGCGAECRSDGGYTWALRKVSRRDLRTGSH